MTTRTMVTNASRRIGLFLTLEEAAAELCAEIAAARAWLIERDLLRSVAGRELVVPHELAEAVQAAGPGGGAPLPSASSTTIEPADLDVRDVAAALGCSVRTVERAISAGRLDGLALPIVIGGLDRRRYRWRASQLPAIRAVFAPPARPVSPPPATSAPVRSAGRPSSKRSAKDVDQGPRKDILARLRDGD